MKILHIDSSSAGDHSVSRRYSAEVVSELLVKYPGSVVTYHDVATKPFKLVDSLLLGALFTEPVHLTDAQKAAIAPSDQATDELLVSDIVVIGSPMHNFSVPSSLKTWIDSVVRLGKTFRYSEMGPVGLIPGGKKVYLVLSRGGVYSEGPAAAFDHQESYLRAILGFIGLTDVTVILAEGTTMGPEAVSRMTNSVSMQMQQAFP